MSMKRFLIVSTILSTILSLTAGAALASPAATIRFVQWKGAGLKLKRVKLSSTTWLYRLTSLPGQKFRFVISNRGHAMLLAARCRRDQTAEVRNWPLHYRVHTKWVPGGSMLSVMTGRHGAVIDLSTISVNGTDTPMWDLHDKKRLCSGRDIGGL